MYLAHFYRIAPVLALASTVSLFDEVASLSRFQTVSGFELFSAKVTVIRIIKINIEFIFLDDKIQLFNTKKGSIFIWFLFILFVNCFRGQKICY